MARTSRPTNTPEFDRDGISHRIRSLLTKTVENGVWPTQRAWHEKAQRLAQGELPVDGFLDWMDDWLRAKGPAAT